MDIQNEVKNLRTDLTKAKKCIKEKDERITSIENRWDNFIFCILICVVGLCLTAFSWFIIQVNNAIPNIIYRPNYYSNIVCRDWLLFISLWSMIIFAGIGFIATLYFIYKQYND